MGFLFTIPNTLEANLALGLEGRAWGGRWGGEGGQEETRPGVGQRDFGHKTPLGSPSNQKLSLDHFGHSQTVGDAVPGTVSHADPQTLVRSRWGVRPSTAPLPSPSPPPRPRAPAWPPAQLTPHSLGLLELMPSNTKTKTETNQNHLFQSHRL